MILEVHYEVEIPEKDIAKIMKYAKDQGYDWGDDPGPKLVMQRLLVEEGIDFFNELVKGGMLKHRLLKKE